MKKLLLVMGDLATGKSTFAGILSRRYQIVALYKDTFKEVLGDSIGFANREENLRLSFASAALMRMIFTEFCKLEKDLILESNFRQAELEMLHEIANEYNYQVMTVSLRADLKVLHKRFLHRLYHENRHPVHACGGFEKFDTFQDYVRNQRKLEIPGRSLELSADTFDYQQDATVFVELDQFMGC
jgi:predicted kinase